MKCGWCGEDFERVGSGSGRKYHCSDFCRFMSKVRQTPSCWVWEGNFYPNGYGKFWLSDVKRYTCAHVASVLLVKREDIPEDLEVRHLCHNKACVRPEHLMVGTRSENRQDSIRDKGHYIGERHSQAKLSESDVRQIRAELEAGVRQVDLAKRYGVANATINLIALRRNWRHL